jgi:hypothetical protein
LGAQSKVAAVGFALDFARKLEGEKLSNDLRDRDGCAVRDFIDGQRLSCLDVPEQPAGVAGAR